SAKMVGARRFLRRAPLTHQPACKPGFVGRELAPSRDGHSSATPIARRLKQPTRTARSGHRSPACSPLSQEQAGAVPIRSCSRWVLPCRRHCCRRGALLPHRFTLALLRPRATEGGLFSVALSLGSHPPDVIRHRTSMEPGLSSRARLSALARAAV